MQKAEIVSENKVILEEWNTLLEPEIQQKYRAMSLFITRLK